MPRHTPLALAALVILAPPAGAVDIDGLLDVRLAHTNSADSWTEGGLGKLQYDQGHEGLRLGQANLNIAGDLLDTVRGDVAFSAADDRHGVVDINEAYLNWKPVPTHLWRAQMKAGAFFAPFSLENDGPSWTTTRTLSASAIDSWLGEELRTKGVEVSLLRPGRFAAAPYDLDFTLAAFQGNESAGSLLAYRGWSVGDRITGLTETVPLAAIPIYGPNGPLAQADKKLDDFHQIDGRVGYYLGARYRYRDILDFAANHYDNGADPARYAHDQWAWHTRFDELNLKLTPSPAWEVLAQGMHGSTQWSARPSEVDFRAWYALADYRWGENLLAARYDRFNTWQPGFMPTWYDDEDYYAESGHAWTLSYTHELREDLRLTAEWVRVSSDRSAREFLQQPDVAHEESFVAALRWSF